MRLPSIYLRRPFIAGPSKRGYPVARVWQGGVARACSERTARARSEFHPPERLDADAQRYQGAQDADDQAGADRDRQPES